RGPDGLWLQSPALDVDDGEPLVQVPAAVAGSEPDGAARPEGAGRLLAHGNGAQQRPDRPEHDLRRARQLAERHRQQSGPAALPCGQLRPGRGVVLRLERLRVGGWVPEAGDPVPGVQHPERHRSRRGGSGAEFRELQQSGRVRGKLLRQRPVGQRHRCGGHLAADAGVWPRVPDQWHLRAFERELQSVRHRGEPVRAAGYRQLGELRRLLPAGTAAGPGHGAVAGGGAAGYRWRARPGAERRPVRAGAGLPGKLNGGGFQHAVRDQQEPERVFRGAQSDGFRLPHLRPVHEPDIESDRLWTLVYARCAGEVLEAGRPPSGRRAGGFGCKGPGREVIVTQIATLNSEAHRELRVDGRPSAAYGDSQRFVQVIVGEFAHLVVHYPILFSKDATSGQLHCGVMLGYDPGENLYLEEWRERRMYRPLLLQRAPFCAHGRSLAIDLDHPRVGVEAGEALFLDDGRPTEYLKSVMQAFRYLQNGMRATDTFVARLLELKLIEPIDLEAEFDDGS